MKNLFSPGSLVVFDAIIEQVKSEKHKVTYRFSISLMAIILGVVTLSGLLQFDLNPLDEKQFEPYEYAICNDGVRVRLKPTTDSQSEGILYKEDKVTVIDKTRKKTKVNLDNKSVLDYWYNVEYTYLKNDKEFIVNGWIFGQFINPRPELQSVALQL